LLVTSYTTRFTPFTSLMMRVAGLAKQLGFAPVKLGKLNEGGAPVHARDLTVIATDMHPYVAMRKGLGPALPERLFQAILLEIPRRG